MINSNTNLSMENDTMLKGQHFINSSAESKHDQLEHSKKNKALFSWELFHDKYPIDQYIISHKKRNVNNYIGYLLLIGVILGFILAFLISIFLHQLSGLNRAVIGLRLEIYYSTAIFIIILSCIILWSSKHAFNKNSIAWVLVGAAFCLLIAFSSIYIINLKSIEIEIFFFSILTIILFEIIIGTISFILIINSRNSFQSGF